MCVGTLQTGAEGAPSECQEKGKIPKASISFKGKVCLSIVFSPLKISTWSHASLFKKVDGSSQSSTVSCRFPKEFLHPDPVVFFLEANKLTM